MIIFTLQYVHIIFHLFPHMSNAGFHADSVDSVSALKCVQVSTSGSSAIPHELLYGHAGYLYSLLFVSFNLPVMSAGLDELIEHQVDVLLKQGERQAREQGVCQQEEDLDSCTRGMRNITSGPPMGWWGF